MPYSHTSGPLPQRLDALAVDLGYKAWTSNPSAPSTTQSPTTQRIIAGSLELVVGTVCTDICIEVAQAAVGTNPTGAYVGLADSTGKMLAQSSNLNADAGWTTLGIQPFALSAPYTIPASGLYYAVHLINGTWGTTQPTFVCQSVNAGWSTALGSNPRAWGIQAGQATLPANGSSITFDAGGDGRAFWMAVA